MKVAACAAVTCLALSLTGCQRPPSVPAAPAVPVAQDTPEHAATSLLRVLHAHLQARAAEQWTAADQYRDQALTSLVHRDDILARYRAIAGPVAKSDQEALQDLVENWAAALAYYADDMRCDEFEVRPGREADRALVAVPAFAGASCATLQVAVTRCADERWRVVGFELGPRPPLSTRPTTSMPAAATSATHP